MYAISLEFIAGWNGYYMFENQYNQCDTRGWEVRLMLFRTMVVQVLLYEVEVWGGTTPLRARNEVEKIQKTFSCTGNWGYLSILYYHVIRNMSSAHRGTTPAKHIYKYTSHVIFTYYT